MAGVITSQGHAFTAYFEATAKACGDAKAASNWLTNRVLATLNQLRVSIRDYPLSADRLAGLIAEQKSAPLNKQAAEGWQLAFMVLEQKRFWLFWQREAAIVTLGR